MKKEQNEKKLINNLPNYIADELDKIRATWKKTEAECHAEGNMTYNADERMKKSLKSSIAYKNVDTALQNIENYGWMDYYLGIAGKGLFIREALKEELRKKALTAIISWKNTTLGK